MNKEVSYKTPQNIIDNANINEVDFNELYKESLENPDKFWGEQAEKYLDWYQKWTKVQESDFSKGKFSWFLGGKLNASYNCIDRHLPEKGNNIALILSLIHISEPTRPY